MLLGPEGLSYEGRLEMLWWPLPSWRYRGAQNNEGHILGEYIFFPPRIEKLKIHEHKFVERSENFKKLLRGNIWEGGVHMEWASRGTG